jgi:ferrous iron transport protein B
VKVLLIGHPNVGKSVIFNRLTGANVISSNYPGTTVDYSKGYMRQFGRDIELIDVPGTFSLEPKDKAEEVAVKMLRDNPDARIICVIDAAKIERGLYLVLELIQQGFPIVVSLNMWDVAHDKNIIIDEKKLESILGIPVVPTVAISAEGISELVYRLEDVKPGSISDIVFKLKYSRHIFDSSCSGCVGCSLGSTGQKEPLVNTLNQDERWDLVEDISSLTITFGHFLHTLKDALGDYTVKPATGIPFAIAMLYAFWSIFTSFAGFFTDGFLVKIFDGHWLPMLQQHFPGGAGNWFYSLMVDAGQAADGIAAPSKTCLESFGVLTSGLFLPLGIVLPAIFIFYVMLALLEDIGYMARLAVLMDTFLHKIGLHGYAIVPTILSLGCNVPGVEATRILETRKQRFMMMTLLAVFIPCSAQIGIMQEVIPDHIGFVMAYLFVGYFIFGFILNKIVPGKTPEILMDVPPYQKPIPANITRKVMMRTTGFLREGVPFVMVGILLVNGLYVIGAIDFMASFMAPVFEGWFGVPKETAGPLVAAFLRKDLAIAQLGAIVMSPYQMISSVVLVTIYFPCVATFIMMLKEGGRAFIGSVIALMAVVFTYGGLLHLIWKLMGVA